MRLWTFAALFLLLAHDVICEDTEAPILDTEPSNSTNITTEAPTKEPFTNATQLTEAPTKEPSTNATQTTETPTKEPATNATQVTESPTEGPSTSPPITHAPGSETWFVNDTGELCILLRMWAEFRLPVPANKTVTLPADAIVAEGSTCNGSSGTQIIKLSFDHYYFTLIFVENDTICGNKKFCQNSIILEDPSTDTNYTGNATDVPLFGAKTGNSYLCKADSKFNLTSGSQVAEVTVKNVQVQAFRTEKTKDFGTKEECVADDHPNDIVPIAVGCALAGLVIIVLIAYLVGRRRNRQKGYQSV